MIKKVSFCFYILLLVPLLLSTGCSKSDDQRRFEDQAQAEPQGITETSGSGESTGQPDPDDWRIAPMYSGLIHIEVPAYPNPVNFNSNLRIDIDIRGPEVLSRLEVYSFEYPGQLHGPLSVLDNPTYLQTVSINAEAIANSSGGSGASGLYRLLLYDGRENLISYGDVRVQ